MDTKKGNHGHRWTDEEMKVLIEGWNLDVPHGDLAEQLNVTPHAVRTMVVRLRRMGIPLKKRTRGNIAGRLNQLWSQSEIEYLARRRNDGALLEEIASEMGRSFGGVQSMAGKLRNKHGVPIRANGQGRKALYDTEALRALYVDKTYPLSV